MQYYAIYFSFPSYDSQTYPTPGLYILVWFLICRLIALYSCHKFFLDHSFLKILSWTSVLWGDTRYSVSCYIYVNLIHNSVVNPTFSVLTLLICFRCNPIWQHRTRQRLCMFLSYNIWFVLFCANIVLWTSTR